MSEPAVSTPLARENKGEREKGRGGEERPKIKNFHCTLVLMGTPFFGAAPPAGRLRRAESTESTERYFSASPQSTYSGLWSTGNSGVLGKALVVPLLSRPPNVCGSGCRWPATAVTWSADGSMAGRSLQGQRRQNDTKPPTTRLQASSPSGSSAVGRALKETEEPRNDDEDAQGASRARHKRE